MEPELYRTGATRVSDRVLEAVADARGTDPLELDRPLYDVVDPDALDALFAADDGTDTLRVEFTYGGYRVTVRGDGQIGVRATD